MNTGESLNYIQMVTHSGVVVTAVLLLLVLSSLGSWTIIFRKALHLRRAREQSAQFLETFWRSKRLDQIYSTAENKRRSSIRKTVWAKSRIARKLRCSQSQERS